VPQQKLELDNDALRGTLERVREEADKARNKLHDARRELSEAEIAFNTLRSLETEIDRGHLASALLVLRRSKDYVDRLKRSRNAFAKTLDALQGALEEEASRSASRFGREFPAAARAAGLEIDSTSRHPLYTFKRGFIRLEVDDRRATAKITPRDGDTIEVGLDVEVIVERLRKDVDRLFNQPFNAKALLRSVYTAYKAALRSEKKREGDEVPLRRLTNRLSKNLNNFAADEFNVQLSQLVASGELEIDGRRLHLNHSRNARQGMLLYGMEDGGYVGFISFKAEDGS
jgi:hypothetical protein